MKAREALLFTFDAEFESMVRQAVLGTEIILRIARTVDEALQIVCQQGRGLDLAPCGPIGRAPHGPTTGVLSSNTSLERAVQAPRAAPANPPI